MTRLIDADALLAALPKDDVLLSCNVRRIILDQPRKAMRYEDYVKMHKGNTVLLDYFCSSARREENVNDKS